MFSKKSSAKSAGTKNVVTLNVYADKKYSSKGNSFQPLKKLAYNTSNFVTAYISNKDIISTVIHESRSLAEGDIDTSIEIKTYEELGLDQANSYIIDHCELDDAGEEREFHVFVAEPNVLNDLYFPVKKQTKFIDLIVPAPLLYQTLYRRDILQDSSTHCFVYFTQSDAFVTLYKNGQYLYSKSIEFSLEQIYDKHCESVGEKVNDKEFYTVLESEGLKATNSEYQTSFMKIFSEAFITINDIIIYAKRAFNLDMIDQMFIGSERGPIIGLDDYSQNYLGLHSTDFNFNYDVSNEEWYTDQLQYLMLLSSYDYMEDDSSVVNLTIYPRAPSFLNRASGQFIISTFAAISVSLAYPMVYLVGSYINDATIYALTSENNSLTQEANKYKKILKEKLTIIKGLDKKIEGLSIKYNSKTKTLTSIYDKKVNYRLKSSMYHTIAEELNKFEVYVDMVKTDNDTIWMSMVSSDDRKFTEVIKYMSDQHFNEIVKIDIEKIVKDPVSNYYKGLLKVELK